MEQFGTLSVKRSKIGVNGAGSGEPCLAAEAAGDFLFDLGHAYGLLGDVV